MAWQPCPLTRCVGAVQSLQALYAACVDELVPLVQQCPNANPVVKDPTAPFATPAELQIRGLV